MASESAIVAPAIMKLDVRSLLDDDDPRTWPWLLRISAICALFMLGFPVPEGYDVAQHIRFAAEYKDALLDGTFVPVWPLIDNLGFGGVGIRVYPPFADFVLALTQLLTNDWYKTLLINSFVWMLPGCIGVFFLVSQFRESRYAAFAAVLYAAMPYHLLQVYRMQLYSEYVASAILPFCFLYATKLIRRRSIGDIVGLTISCSLLTLTHIPSSVIGFLGLGVYVALTIDWQRPWKAIAGFATSAVLAIAATGFYLIRLVNEMAWVKHSESEFSTGFFSYSRHLFPLSLYYDDQYPDFDMKWLDLPIALSILFLIPLVIVAIAGRKSHRENRAEFKLFVAVSATGIFSVFMLSGLSDFVWKNLPMLQKLQFPWRFLSVASLMGAVSLALAIAALKKRFASVSPIVRIAIASLILGTLTFDVFYTILPAPKMDREEFHETVSEIREKEGCTCWWPKWAERGVLDNQAQVVAGDRDVNVVQWQAATREFEIGSGEQVTARVATFYYPYWKATANGEPVAVDKDESGAISISIPTGVSRVRLFFDQPAEVKVSLWVSLFTWLLLLFAAVSILFRNYFRSRSSTR